MLKKYCLYFFVCLFSVIASQNAWPTLWPLDFAPVLTANYGQLRPNHFHAGIDFSTNGKENLPVKSIDIGYVSRIKVSAYGYGKALYITHPNGKVTVYAHLNAYNKRIDSLIKSEQYKRQTYEIDYYPTYHMPIKKGENIGLSGNTGGSSGPHLHFEIRDEVSEVPLNPLNFYRLNDHINPSLQALAIFDLSDTLNPSFIKSIKVLSGKNGAVAAQASITINQSIIGMAYAGFDKNDGNGHLNNIYATSLMVDDKEIYTHLLQAVSFDESRYVNEFATTVDGLAYQKCFLPVLAPADFVMNSSKNTRIVLKDTNYHRIKLVVADEAGNQTSISLAIRCKKFTKYYSNLSHYDVIVDCKKPLNFTKEQLNLQCPPYTFFMSSPLTIKNSLAVDGRLLMLPVDLNLKSALDIRLKIPPAYASHKEKMLLKNGSTIYMGQCRGDSLIFQVKSLGHFQLCADFTAPSIQFKQAGKQKNSQVGKRLSFFIKDNLSGIYTYKLFINKQYCLAEFDAKSNLLTYTFSAIDPVGSLEVLLEVFDKAGNKATLAKQITR